MSRHLTSFRLCCVLTEHTLEGSVLSQRGVTQEALQRPRGAAVPSNQLQLITKLVIDCDSAPFLVWLVCICFSSTLLPSLAMNCLANIVFVSVGTLLSNHYFAG